MESLDFIQEFISHMEFSNVGWQILSTLIFMLADYVTGFVGAVIQKNVDSQKMREGLLRKAMLVLVVFLSFIIQYSFNISVISKIVCAYIIIMEIVSIFENLKKAGIDLGKLGEILKIKSENETVDVIIKNEETTNESGESEEKKDEN